MNTGINYTALAVLVGLFLLVTVMGFWASNWRRGEHLASLDEWGLGGRTFGTWVTWFLLGGDLTRPTRSWPCPPRCSPLGAVAGFFAVPYTIILYPIIFIYMARLWSVSYRHGYVTSADFVRGRYGSQGVVAGGVGHRHPGHHALHRTPARRHPGGPRSGRPRRFGQRHSRRTCRCSSRSRCSPRIPIRPGCARPR